MSRSSASDVAAGLPVRWEFRRPLPVSEDFAARTALAVTIAALASAARKVPPLYSAGGPDYQLDPRGCNMAVPADVTARRGSGDCQDLTAWRLAERYQRTGSWPRGLITSGGRPGLIHVRLTDEDPSKRLIEAGRFRSERRGHGPECDYQWEVAGIWQDLIGLTGKVLKKAGDKPPEERRNLLEALFALLDAAVAPKRREEAGRCECAGQSRSRDESALHPLLQRTLARGRDAGLHVYMYSGARTVGHQIELWEARMRGRAAPASWRSVEADFDRWGPWVLGHSKGEIGEAPPLAPPGLSRHQATPARAMDVGVSRGGRDATLARLEQVAPAGVFRPMKREPWHFAV